ncbi:hypothetical protein PTTG_07692 [Puccinia triticina 1-1 BBBD Race 1]|uniref:DUF7729 domain-containing protein n=1 Tax=Puccinia triticina (isolate 1-1 / race 1 (BBBD)) TaxID=630390 RepID=A0A180H0X6_PUCT1|nr:hypothetical protein PTTG_07692 [Puccinia triticina 1-1 BBBD Race 1]
MPNPSRCRWSNVKNWFIFAAATAALSSSPSLVASAGKLEAARRTSSISSSRSSSFLRYFDASSNTASVKASHPHHQQYPVSRQQPQFSFITHQSFSASQPVSTKSNHDSLGPFDEPTPQDRHRDRESQRKPLMTQHGHLTKRTEFDSETCGPFISQFLKNAAFRECHPISLLLTTSQGFYQAGRALNTFSTLQANQTDSVDSTVMPVDKVLDASCKADPDQCQVLFDQLSSNIKSPRFGCGKDLDKRNSLAVQALAGLSSYRLMREVACLTTRETPTPGMILAANPVKNLTNTTIASQRTSVKLATMNSSAESAQPSVRYCFVNAMSSPTPDDLYYYYLPLGTNLPSGTHPSCNDCTKSIMKLYALSISSNDLTLRDSYPSARTMTNSRCGPGFAPMPLKDANRLASSTIRRFPCIASIVQVWALAFVITVFLVFPSVF